MTRDTDYLSLGESFEEKGKYFKAERLYKKALSLKIKQVEPTSAELVPYLYNLAMVQAALDKNDEALRTFDQLLPIMISEFGEEHVDIKEIRNVMNDLVGESQELVVNA